MDKDKSSKTTHSPSDVSFITPEIEAIIDSSPKNDLASSLKEFFEYLRKKNKS